MQQTLIVQGNNGYLHLAHRYGRVVQISVENFTDWDDAASWCNAHSMHALLQFEGLEIPVKYWTILRLMSRDKAHTTSDLCSMLAAYRSSLQHRSKGPFLLRSRPSTCARRSPSWNAKASSRLSAPAPGARTGKCGASWIPRS